MSFFVPAIDPLYAIGSNININKVSTKADVQREFVSVFMSQILKEVFKSQSSMFGEEGELGMFSDNLYNDVLLTKISRDMAESKAFGFDDLIANSKK